MRGTAGRALPAAVVGALGLATLHLGMPQLRTPAAAPATTRAEPLAVRKPIWTQRVDTLRPGETLSTLLTRAGVASATAASVLEAASAIDARRVPAGLVLTIRRQAADSLPAEVVFQLGVDHMVNVRRTGEGWTSEEIRLPWTVDTVVVSGVISSTLYEALDSSAAAVLPPAQRAELAWSLADIFEYRVDMSRELRRGDAFRALFVRSTGPNGAARVNGVLAARFQLSGKPVEAIRFASTSTRHGYFDQDGKSLRAAFLRAPLAFRRISSVFGRRKHPILGVWRTHRGMDYAASAGTPVRSVGEGVVIFAGRRGGYGKVVEVRHRNGYVSRYGHLRGFAKKTRRGARVGIGQTIGYVGSTGLATGPHLHFEMLVNGVHRDPRKALRGKSGFPVPAADRTRFDGVRATLVAALDQPALGEQVAAR